MAKKKKTNQCQYCGGKTDLPSMHHPMIPINEWMEKKIDKLGRNDWFKKIDLDNPTEEEEQLIDYDQLTNTLGRGYVCQKCLEVDDVVWNKYYQGNVGTPSQFMYTEKED